METAAVSISTEVIIFPPISRMDTSSCCPDTWETAIWSTQSGTAGYRRETAVWPLTWFKNCHDFYFILNKRLFLASGKPYTRKDHCLVPDIIKILIFIYFFLQWRRVALSIERENTNYGNAVFFLTGHITIGLKNGARQVAKYFSVISQVTSWEHAGIGVKTE